MAAGGLAARRGILIRDAQALESGAAVDTIVLDKTGTITWGRRRGVDVTVAEGVDPARLAAAAAAVEMQSRHPLSEAIVEYARAYLQQSGRAAAFPQLQEVQQIEGRGLQAESEWGVIRVGNEKLLQEHDVGVPAEIRKAAQRTDLRRSSLIFVAIDDRCLGLLAAEDAVAPGAEDAVAQLQLAGMHVVMLTGDRRETAEYVAGQIGAASFQAEVLPAGKCEFVADLMRRGRRTAMVGDGVNDAAALAQADFGVAIGDGADAALESADVVLVRRDLRGVVELLTICRAALKTIRQNLAWALGYNLLLIPLAAGLFIPIFGWRLAPAAAAAAMAASSVSVVLNSLRLQSSQFGGIVCSTDR